MVQVFQLPEDRRASNLSNAIAQTVNQNVAPYIHNEAEFQRNKSRLQEAFNNLEQNKGGNFLQKLSAIAPTLASTPGGPQLLGELSPLLAKQNIAGNQLSMTRPYNPANLPPGFGGVESRPQPQAQGMPNAKPLKGEDYYRQRQEDQGISGTTFPSANAQYEPLQEWSPAQIDARARQKQEQSLDTANPMSYQEARKEALEEAQIIIESNRRLNEQREKQLQSQKELSQRLVTRAEEAGYIKPEIKESRSVAEKLALEARDKGDLNKQWEYVRSGLIDFENHYNALTRGYEQPNLIKKQIQKLNGTYKDKQQALKELEPNVQWFKDHGLFNEARDLLAAGVGLGPEDIESTLFPLKKEELNDLNKFPKNQKKVVYENIPGFPKMSADNDLLGQFPDERYNLEPKEFEKFQSQISDYFKKYPKANLISLRGYLNQQSRYSWNDISKAINNLVRDGEFIPDPVQDQQLNVIKNAPLPGLLQQFKYYFKDTK